LLADDSLRLRLLEELVGIQPETVVTSVNGETELHFLLTLKVQRVYILVVHWRGRDVKVAATAVRLFSSYKPFRAARAILSFRMARRGFRLCETLEHRFGVWFDSYLRLLAFDEMVHTLDRGKPFIVFALLLHWR